MLQRLALPSLPKGQKLLAVTGYAAFFVACFVLFAYWSFPYGRVREFLISKVSSELGYQLSIGELTPYWVSGLHLSEVTLTKPAPDANSQPVDLKLEEATARASLLSLLLGDFVVSFWASDGTGEIEGSYTHGETEFAFEAELTELDLGAVGVGEWLGLPVRGLASGEVVLAVPENLTESDVRATLTISKLALGDGKAKLKLPPLRDGFTVERIDAGDLTLQIATENGVAMVKQLSSQGPDLKLKGDGTLRLVRPFARSRGDFSVAVTFTDKYKQRNDRTKAVFQLLDFQPDLKRATADDGTMTFRLSGPLNAIRGVPAGAPMENKGSRKSRRTRGT